MSFESEAYTQDYTLVGKLYGTGEVGVVLPPSGWGIGQGSWLDYPAELARSGYMVLTFNFKGQCTVLGSDECSEGAFQSLHGLLPVADLEAAVDFMRSRGAQQVFLIGARFSALHVLALAAEDDFTGIATLSAGMTIGAARAFDEALLPWPKDVTEPHLMIYPQQEARGGRRLSSLSGGPHDLVLVPGSSFGGAGMLTGSTEPETSREAVLTFLQRHTDT